MHQDAREASGEMVAARTVDGSTRCAAIGMVSEGLDGYSAFSSFVCLR